MINRAPIARIYLVPHGSRVKHLICPRFNEGYLPRTFHTFLGARLGKYVAVFGNAKPTPGSVGAPSPRQRCKVLTLTWPSHRPKPYLATAYKAAPIIRPYKAIL